MIPQMERKDVHDMMLRFAKNKWVNSAFFEKRLHLYGAQLRDHIKAIRKELCGSGYTIISGSRGYKVTEDVQFILEYADRMRSRALAIMETASDMKRAVSSEQRELVL